MNNKHSGILVDTSALIALVNTEDVCHTTVKAYIEQAVLDKLQIHLSSLTVAEFCVRQNFSTIDTATFIISSFETPEAILAGKFDSFLNKDTGDSRQAMKIDIMLIAHAQKLRVAGLLTLDAKSMAKYCHRLLKQGSLETNRLLP